MTGVFLAMNEVVGVSLVIKGAKDLYLVGPDQPHASPPFTSRVSHVRHFVSTQIFCLLMVPEQPIVTTSRECELHSPAAVHLTWSSALDFGDERFRCPGKR